MASAASTLHQKDVVAVCLMMILLSTGPSAMAYIQPNCTADCDAACRAYGQAACRSNNGAWCQKLQECEDQIYFPCCVTCNKRCNSTPIQC
ncbi:hypothetical protein SEVIR_6G116832v4 [Setaria viridis]|uniref:Knottin scorpion toxin-like domain-containing protein n=2 Tax=Setaria TaxID=4554 RepID=K3YKH1_SETIT|nr:hypothetical protein SEVIR_6G116832v2 [Setaria viridis]